MRKFRKHLRRQIHTLGLTLYTHQTAITVAGRVLRAINAAVEVLGTFGLSP